MVRRPAERNAQVYRFAAATGHGRTGCPEPSLVTANALICHPTCLEESAMSMLLRHRPTLHSFVLACAVLLLAALSLAIAHVHGDETACIVCGHADNPTAAKDPSAVFPASRVGRSVVGGSALERPDRPLLRSFDPRGPPVFVR
jgi:hypothetical protein